MRLFIAVNFNDNTKSRLLALRDGLRARSSGGNFSAPGNLHLTLAFLGECDVRQTNAVKAVMDTIRFATFEIIIDRVGRFGETWWVGLRESKSLLQLQRELSGKLIAAGFALEQRQYTPHITLGREVTTDTRPHTIEPFGETVCAVELMKSERVTGKLTYTEIYKKTCDM